MPSHVLNNFENPYIKTFYFANKISLRIEGKCYKRYYKYPNIHQTFDVKSLNLLNSSRFLS